MSAREIARERERKRESARERESERERESKRLPIANPKGFLLCKLQ